MSDARVRGFTLMEMMVVIAIIGILLSIGIPNYTRAREQAKQRGAARALANWVAQARTLAIARKTSGTLAAGDPLPRGTSLCVDADGDLVILPFDAVGSCAGTALAGPFEIERDVTIQKGTDNKDITTFTAPILSFRVNGTLYSGADQNFTVVRSPFPNLAVQVTAGGFANQK